MGGQLISITPRGSPKSLVNQSQNQSISHSGTQSVSQSVNQSVNQSINLSLSQLDSRLFAYLSRFISLKDKCSKFPRLSRSISQSYQFVQRSVNNSFMYDRLHIDAVNLLINQSISQSIHSNYQSNQSLSQSVQSKCRYIPLVGTLIGDESKVEFRPGRITQSINQSIIQSINQSNLHSLGWSYGAVKSPGSLPVILNAIKEANEQSNHRNSINQSSVNQSSTLIGSINQSINSPNHSEITASTGFPSQSPTHSNSINPSPNHSSSHNQSVNQSDNQLTNQFINQSANNRNSLRLPSVTNNSIYQSSVNQSINQSSFHSKLSVITNSTLINQSINQPIKTCSLTRLDLRLSCDLESFRSIDWSVLSKCHSIKVFYISLPPVVRDRYSDLKLLSDHLPQSINRLGIHVGDWSWNQAFKNPHVLPYLQHVQSINHSNELIDLRVCAELASTIMHETSMIRPIQSIDSRLIDDTDIRYLSYFTGLRVLHVTFMPDRLSSFLRCSDSSLAHLSIVTIQIPPRVRFPVSSVDPAPLFLFLAKRPITEFTLSISKSINQSADSQSSECHMLPINRVGLEALGKMIHLRRLVVRLPTRGKRLFTSDDISRLIDSHCWPDLHTLILIPDLPILTRQIDCLLRASPQLKNLSLTASCTCIGKLAVYGQQLVRVDLQDTRRDHKSPISLHDMQHALSITRINQSSFPHLFLLKITDALSPSAYHFLLSRLRYARYLRYFMDDTFLFPLVRDREIFLVLMQSVLPRLDTIIPSRYSKSIQHVFKRDTYSTCDFIEIARYDRTCWCFDEVCVEWSEDEMLHEIHKSETGVYCRFKQHEEQDGEISNGRQAFFMALANQLNQRDQDRLAMWESGNYCTSSWKQSLRTFVLNCIPGRRRHRSDKKVLPAVRARTAQMTSIM